MGETSIEWCHYTFNPWRGCAKVSTGCVNCYAETMSRRNPAVLGEWGPAGERAVAAESYWRLPGAWNLDAGRAGERRRVFCGSLMDVFEDRPELVPYRARLFDTIVRTPNLDWLLLTKRPAKILRLWPGTSVPYAPTVERGGHEVFPNVWLGVSAEDQQAADERIPLLLQTPAAVRFVSYEPALGPVDLAHLRVPKATTRIVPVNQTVEFDALRGMRHTELRVGYLSPRIDWVIVGGESGPGRRPMDLAWLESIDRQTREAGIPLFVKQDNGTRPGKQGRIPDGLWARKEFPR